VFKCPANVGIAGKYISTAKGDNASIEASNGRSNVNEAFGLSVILLISNTVNAYYVIIAKESVYIKNILCKYSGVVIMPQT
jgi:hypothetical protein